MTYEEKYSELGEIDDNGMANKLFDIYVALSFLQNNTRIIKADDFSVACLLGTTPKLVKVTKKLLYENEYINYNTDEKVDIIKENSIIADLNTVEIMKS